jgi:hypothetical protein
MGKPRLIMNWKILTEYPDETTLAAWREFLADSAYPTHYTTPGFFTDPFIRGGEKFAVLVFDEEKVVAVLTGIDTGKTIVSGLAVRPQAVFRKNIDRGAASKALLEGTLEKGGERLEVMSFHTWEPVEGIERLGFSSEVCGGGGAVVMLDLNRGADVLFKDFSQTRQSELRKAMKKTELIVKDLETEDELNELYDIHVEWNKRKGNQPDSSEDFARISQDHEHRKTLIAVYQGKVIAGTFFRFCRGGLIEYAGNNSLEEYQKLRPNPLIGWRAIEWACENGFSYFSMGASHEFLRRFGGDIHSNYRYTFDRTFLKRHEKKAKLKKLIVDTYLYLPISARRKIKQAFGKT